MGWWIVSSDEFDRQLFFLWVVEKKCAKLKRDHSINKHYNKSVYLVVERAVE